MKKKVNLFLVGAQKSGSTFLAGLLSQHPDISGGLIKSPNYFNRLFAKTTQIDSLEQYHDIYDFEKEFAMDSSDCYHVDPEAIGRILRYNPDAKFIIVIRDVKEMIVSLHDHLLWAEIQSERDICKAFQVSDGDKKRPEYNPFLDYKRICSVADQLHTYLQTVSTENLIAIKFEELKADPSSVLERIEDRLGLQHARYNLDAASKNSRKGRRSRVLGLVLAMIKPSLKTKVKLGFSRYGINLDSLSRGFSKKSSEKSNVNYVISSEIEKFADLQNRKIDALLHRAS